ncbi:MAG: hypothetical protein GY842_29140 [bacterium]|nr:hypothetical protein [bacterium]
MRQPQLVERFPAISSTGEVNILNVVRRGVVLTAEEATAGVRAPAPAMTLAEARFVGAVLRAATAEGGAIPVRAGQVGVARALVDFERAGFGFLGEEITMETAAARTRIDLFMEAPELGGIVPGTAVRVGALEQLFVEVKTGSGRLSTNQQLAFPVIRQQGGIPRGARAGQARLPVGQQSKRYTVIIIRR